jgi:hypothetical protein
MTVHSIIACTTRLPIPRDLDPILFFSHSHLCKFCSVKLFYCEGSLALYSALQTYRSRHAVVTREINLYIEEQIQE